MLAGLVTMNGGLIGCVAPCRWVGESDGDQYLDSGARCSRIVARRTGPLARGVLRYQNVGVVLLATVAGLVVPLPAWSTRVVTPIVVLLIYGSFRDLSFDNTGLEFVALTVGGLVVTYTLSPVIAVVVGQHLLSRDALLGVVIMAAGPTTAGSALVWTRLDGGETALTASIALATLVLAPVVVPGVLMVLVIESVSLALWPIIEDLLTIVLGGAGLLLLLPNERIDGDSLDTVFLLAIGVLVFVSVGAHNLQGIPLGLVGGIGVTALVLIGSLLVVMAAARRLWNLPPERTRSVFFSTALKNLGVALVVARMVGAGDITLAIIECYIIQQIVAGFVVGAR